MTSDNAFVLFSRNLFLYYAFPVCRVLASYATFVTYVSLGNVMTASTVFTLAMLFYMLKFPINQAGQLLSKAALGVQAMHRISRFMSREDTKKDKVTEVEDTKHILEVKNGTFFVGTTESNEQALQSTKDEEGLTCGAAFTLSNINFNVRRGEVVAVVGSVGAGKTSLLQALLGDIQTSEDTSISMPPSVSYAAQNPFILSSTVRENILFGHPYNKNRYDKVLHQCCLTTDLLQWPAGDETQIGERGVTMSGGQKTRVSVARAVYSNPDICFLDDPLSALDAGTSQILFDNLFENVNDENSLLNNSGIVLVTHAVHILKRVNKILVLDKGECIFYGTYDEMQSIDHPALISMRSSLQLSSEEEDPRRKAPTETLPEASGISNDTEGKKKGELISAEEREHGMSSLSIWYLWFQYAGGLFFIVIQIILMACDRGSYVLIDWWLATWTSSVGQEITIFGRVFPDQYDSQTPYLIVFTLLAVSMWVFLVARSQWAVFGGLRACERVFSTMTHRVLHAPMAYFDTTPLGKSFFECITPLSTTSFILISFSFSSSLHSVRSHIESIYL